MKSHSVENKIIAILLAAMMTLSLMLPLSLNRVSALQTGSQYPAGEIITGSDFSELADDPEIGMVGDYSSLEDASGNPYMTFFHPLETTFSLVMDGGNSFARADFLHLSAEAARSGIELSLTGKLNGISDFVTDVSVRYPGLSISYSSGAIDLIALSGKSGEDNVYFSPVRMYGDGTVVYYNGTEYTQSGVLLTEHQWKNISVAWHVSESAITMDIYINGTLMAQDISLPVGLDTIDSADALFYVTESWTEGMRADIDYFWVYSGEEPEFGLYPEADPDDITAELDLSLLEAGALYTETVKNDFFSLSPLGNTFQVLSAGKNTYLAVNHTAYRPSADIYSQKETIGKSQVAEIAVRLGAAWNGEATVLSPFTTDESGITKRLGLISIDSSGNLRLEESGEVISSVGRESYTVISLVISFDRTTFDVYIDGREALTGATLPSGLERIDGVRLFSIDSVAVSAGAMYIDYGVMYGGAIPAGAEESAEIYYENTFDFGNMSDIAPLEAEGEAALEQIGNGYALTYASGYTGKASLHLPVSSGTAPIYADFMFTYDRLSTDLELVTFTENGKSTHIAAGVSSDGTIYAMSGTDRRMGQRLEHGKSYRITVLGNAENGFVSVYINGMAELCYNAVSDDMSGFDGIGFLCSDRLGSSKVYLDDLTVYRSERKLGLSLTEPELSFTGETTQTGDILISWESVGPAARYTVWRSTSELAPQLQISELTDALSFTDINVTENSTYYYTVCITYIKNGKEYYLGYGENLLAVTAVLPPEGEKPATPAGELPSYTSITVISDDFSGSETSLKLATDNCYLEESSGTLRIINPAESMDIPYFAVESIKDRRAAIFDFKLTVNKNTVGVNVATVYYDSRKVIDIIKLSEEKLTLSDGTELCTLKEGESYRVTVWIDADCAAAAVFIDGECLMPYIDIPDFANSDNTYEVRFCSAIGEASLSADDFLYLETRAFISDYTANPLSPTASVRESENSVMWNAVRGCMYFTLWSSSSPDGNYTVLADRLEGTVYVDSGVSASKYYKVTYTFDSLGVELTVPLSSSASAERSIASSETVTPFLDLGDTQTLYMFLIFVFGILAIAVLLIPFPKKKTEKDDDTSGKA